jgi:hypothetical protein
MFALGHQGDGPGRQALEAPGQVIDPAADLFTQPPDLLEADEEDACHRLSIALTVDD